MGEIAVRWEADLIPNNPFSPDEERPLRNLFKLLETNLLGIRRETRLLRNKISNDQLQAEYFTAYTAACVKPTSRSRYGYLPPGFASFSARRREGPHESRLINSVGIMTH
jgi:hypothetical protein